MAAARAPMACTFSFESRAAAGVVGESLAQRSVSSFKAARSSAVCLA